MPRRSGCGIHGSFSAFGSMVTRLNTHNMADKIKGWVDQFMVPPHQRDQNENITVQDHKWLSGDLQCTLVVTDERVFTESEVRAMLHDLISSQASADVANGWQCGAVADFAGIANKHGVPLDPAN